MSRPSEAQERSSHLPSLKRRAAGAGWQRYLVVSIGRRGAWPRMGLPVPPVRACDVLAFFGGDGPGRTVDGPPGVRLGGPGTASPDAGAVRLGPMARNRVSRQPVCLL